MNSKIDQDFCMLVLQLMTLTFKIQRGTTFPPSQRFFKGIMIMMVLNPLSRQHHCPEPSLHAA